MVKIAVVVFSVYGQILALAESEVKGLRDAGVDVDLYQLPTDTTADASAKADLPVITPQILANYEGFLFGIPSRYGTHPFSFKEFLDSTGQQWQSGAYHGKFAGLFVSSGTQGGGQESVIRNTVTSLIHHGIIFVPLGYKHTFKEMSDLEVIHGGSPWGAGTFAGSTGARFPTETELQIAYTQGKTFAETVLRSYPQDLQDRDHINLNTAVPATRNEPYYETSVAPTHDEPHFETDDANEECYESTNEEHPPADLVEGPVTAVGPKPHNVERSTESHAESHVESHAGTRAGTRAGPGSPPGSPPVNPTTPSAATAATTAATTAAATNAPTNAAAAATAKAPVQSAPAKADQQPAAKTEAPAAKKESGGCCKCM